MPTPESETSDPSKDPGKCSSPTKKCPKAIVVGTPVAIGATSNSIICKGGSLVTQINNTGPDRACTVAHEESHIADWKARYGENLCVGVADGSLPLGGDGYDDFLRKSECKGYKVGKACRERALLTASDADKPAFEAAINRDNAQIAAQCD